MDYIDDRGFLNYSNLKKNSRTQYSRSDYYYGDINKSRGLRKTADRHCHHRRRQFINSEIIRSNKFDEEPMCLKSTTCIQKRHSLSNPGNVSRLCSNKHGNCLTQTNQSY